MEFMPLLHAKMRRLSDVSVSQRIFHQRAGDDCGGARVRCTEGMEVTDASTNRLDLVGVVETSAWLRVACRRSLQYGPTVTIIHS